VAFVLRAVFALGVVALSVWLLKDGKPFGPIFVIAAALWLRRAVETGRLQARLRALR
jgi:hypothetical protein